MTKQRKAYLRQERLRKARGIRKVTDVLLPPEEPQVSYPKGLSMSFDQAVQSMKKYVYKTYP